MTSKPGTMVDLVARAIDNSLVNRPGYPEPPTSYDISEAARAALEAMRKPSNRMLKAACAAMSPGKRPTKARVSNKAKQGIRYRAMIDAALAEDSK